MKISAIFCPAMLFVLIFGFGLRTDHQNIPNRIKSQSAFLNAPIPISEIIPVDAVSSMIGQVNQARVLTDLRKLTGAEQICLDNGCYTITNRYTGSEGLQWAQDYVREELTNLGYYVEIQDWSRSGHSDQNMIIRKTGVTTPEVEIYFVAHMDGVNSPAADDNASGVVSLLELARILSNRSFYNTVVLLFTSGEEEGALGARSYLDELTLQQLNAIKYVVDVDMIGYDANNDGLIELFNGSQPVDFVQSLSAIITSYHIGLTPQIYSDCG